jgi:hypothetical protein
VFKARFGRPPGQWLRAHARRKSSTAGRRKTVNRARKSRR